MLREHTARPGPVDHSRSYLLYAQPLLQDARLEFFLSVEGAVEAPFSLGLDDLRARSVKEVIATLECAGNTPPTEGIRFGHGAVGNARWRGVSLRDILTPDVIAPGATEVLFEGADVGEEEEGETLEVRFGRSLSSRLASTGTSEATLTTASTR